MSLPVGPIVDASGGADALLGTAFAVDSTTLVTAFHCIGDRLRDEVRHGEVVWLVGGERLTAAYLAGDAAGDCALLRLATELPAASEPLALAAGPVGAAWRATGFPASLSDLGAVSISGTVTDPHGVLFGTPAVQLFAEQSGAGFALGGFSGAPVLRRDDDAVIGLIRYNPPRPEAVELGVGGIVFACPSSRVEALLESVGVTPRRATPPEPTGDTGLGEPLSRLPPDRADFTGRASEIQELLATFSGHTDGTGVVVAIYGQPGVGKSALAVRLAHLVAGSYPDGVLHIDLQGADKEPLTVTEAVGRLLGALGVAAAQMPPGEPERLALYQRRLEGTRWLVVLDNARSAPQVRLLLPEAGGCAAVVTSRAVLSTLDATRMLALDVLDEPDAVVLLTRILGDDPRAADTDGITEIVRLCERLPLAVRIAAAQLRARPHWTVAHLVSRLGDERRRLALLEVADLAVRASFDISYTSLSPDLARAFAALGLVEAPDFPPWVLAALLDIASFDAEDLIEQLTEAQLVSFARTDAIGAFRYRCHDLLRLYAGERSAEAFSAPERAAAVERLSSGYLRLALAGTEGLGPGTDTFLASSVDLRWQPEEETVAAVERTPSIPWFVDERPSLVAAVRQAHEAGLWPSTWGLADALNVLFVRQRHGDESLEVKRLALDAARQAGDRAAEASALHSFAGLHLNRGEHTAAVSVLHEAIECYRDLGLDRQYARTILALAVVERDSGDLPGAAGHLAQCVELLGADDELLLASARHNHAIVLREQCRLTEAMAALDHCITVFAAHRDHVGRGRALHTRAVLRRYVGDLEGAETDLGVARPLLTAAGDVRWTAIVDLCSVRILGQRGLWSELLDQLPGCEQMFADIDDNAGTVHVMKTRAGALRALGDHAAALALLEQATLLADAMDDRRTHARLRYSIALTRYRAGDVDAAVGGFGDAAQRCADIDDQPWFLRSRLWLARLAQEQSGAAAATPLWQEVATLAGRLLDLAGPGYRPVWLGQVADEARRSEVPSSSMPD